MIVTACPLLLFSFISNCCPLHKPFGVILCCVYFSHLNPLHVFVKPLNSVIYLHTYSLFPLFSSSLGKFVRWSFCFFWLEYFWKHFTVHAYSSTIHPVCYPSIWRASRAPSIILTYSIQHLLVHPFWQHTGRPHVYSSILQSINLITH